MKKITIREKVTVGESRGSKLGFPTLNLEIKDLDIDDGVYVSEIELKSKSHRSVTFIGSPETFGDKKRRIETHILNFNEDIYGEKVRVKLLEKIRENKKFDSEGKLINQIKKDIKVTNVFWDNRNKNADKKDCRK